jgi:hypothetical protein
MQAHLDQLAGLLPPVSHSLSLHTQCLFSSRVHAAMLLQDSHLLPLEQTDVHHQDSHHHVSSHQHIQDAFDPLQDPHQHQCQPSPQLDHAPPACYMHSPHVSHVTSQQQPSPSQQSEGLTSRSFLHVCAPQSASVLGLPRALHVTHTF